VAGELLTLFTIPKPFRGHIAVIQRNALESWRQLVPGANIVLFGDEDGVARAASELGLRHVPNVARNEFGTPLVNDVFERAQQIAGSDLLGYVNTDIILMSDFVAAVQNVASLRRPFLLVGRRWDLDVKEPIQMVAEWDQDLRKRVAVEGELHAFTGLDYFLFRRGLWPEIPPFAVGRTIWDEWLVDRARRGGALLIDGTLTITIVHQNHHYGSPDGKHGIWTGPEAQKNLELAGGREDYFTLLDASHCLTTRGLRNNLLRPPIRRRLEVGYQLHAEWRWLVGPLLWFVDRSYALRKRFGLAHIRESPRR
jgi:hypothetical protein